MANNIRLRTSLTDGFVSKILVKILEKLIVRKTGARVSLRIGEIFVSDDGTDTTVHLDVTAVCKTTDLSHLIDKW